MDFTNLIDLNTAFTDIFSGLIVALITAVVAAIFVKKYVSQISFSRKMKSLGFESASVDKVTNYERRKLFMEAEEIKMIRVSGLHFFIDNEKLIKESLDRGLNMKFLCSSPYSNFLNDIENMEQNHIGPNGKPIRNDIDKIRDEVFKIYEMYKDTSLQIKFFNTEYRIPFTLGYFKNETIKAWLTVTLPPYISTNNNFILRGFKDMKNSKDNDENFIDMMEVHFDNVWKFGSVAYEEMMLTSDCCTIMDNYDEWKGLYDKAKKNMAKNNNKHKTLLIEVAAQHPLKNGEFPNEEFKSRLDSCIRYYKDEYNNFEKIYIYIPGSRHTFNGVDDKISLSDAGKNYLISKSIPADCIFGEDANNKYKYNEGVYNSIDECYVSSKIYEDNNFSDIACFCSPAQLHRKALAYIKFGIIPNMYSVPEDLMFHDYVDEVFKYIPALINGHKDNINDKIKKSRKPD